MICLKVWAAKELYLCILRNIKIGRRPHQRTGWLIIIKYGVALKWVIDNLADFAPLRTAGHRKT